MSSYTSIAIAALAFTVAGCNPFARSPAVQVSAADANLNTRWHGTLASPADLAGAVQMSGTATMAPGRDAQMTYVTLDLANATPGGVHPWGLHRGQCDRDEGLVGQQANYRSITVGGDGRATTSANVDLHTPTSGRYSVRVHASSANAGMVLACANLAAPSR